MQAWDDWLTEYTSTPIGSLTLFVLVFLMRVMISEWNARRARKKARKKKVA